MKRNLITAAVLLLLGVTLSQCKFKEDIDNIGKATDSLQLIVGTPTFDATIHLEFVDGKTVQNLSDEKVKVILKGENAGKVLSNVGKAETKYETRLGFLDLVLHPDFLKTLKGKSTSQYVDVEISADGYLSLTKRIFLSGTLFQQEEIILTKLDGAPEGVTVAVTQNVGSTNAQGEVVAKVEQLLDGGKQKVVIPQGTVLKGANGKVLSGDINAEVVYYDPLSESAQNAFPGGTDTYATLPDGTEEAVEFKSAGMFAVNLTAGGETVKTFENGAVALQSEVPADLINPATGQPVKAGDQIEMWSKEEDSGAWVYEKMTTVKMVNGKLVLEDEVKHLSYWNWDWYGTTCWNGPKFIFKGDAGRYTIKIRSTVEGTSYAKTTRKYINTESEYYSFVELWNVPSGKKTKFVFEGVTSDGNPITLSPATMTIENMCSGSETHEITVTAPPVPDPLTVNLDISYTSKDGKVKVRPSVWFYTFLSNPYTYNRVWVKDGRTTITVKYDKVYSLSGWYGGSAGKATLKVEKMSDTKVKVTVTPLYVYDAAGSVKVPDPIVKEIDLTGDNVLDVVYNAVVDDNLIDKTVVLN